MKAEFTRPMAGDSEGGFWEPTSKPNWLVGSAVIQAWPDGIR